MVNGTVMVVGSNSRQMKRRQCLKGNLLACGACVQSATIGRTKASSTLLIIGGIAGLVGSLWRPRVGKALSDKMALLLLGWEVLVAPGMNVRIRDRWPCLRHRRHHLPQWSGRHHLQTVAVTAMAAVV